MRREVEEVKGRPEFDLLCDGKYVKRVTEGLLVAVTPRGTEVHTACTARTMFDVIIELEKFVKDSGYADDFEQYKKFRSIDFSDIDGAMKTIDELFEMMTK